MNLRIGYFYPDKLNLYGDNGNIEILVYRTRMRGLKAEVTNISTNTKLKDPNFNLIFMGGGPDSSQKEVYEDLKNDKKSYIQDYINNSGVGLFICGSYQLLGSYYKSSNGDVLDGLNIFDLHTEHFGNSKPRCIGNIKCEINPDFRHQVNFNSVNKVGSYYVGFENHGGRTYLGSSSTPFGTVEIGFGNNGEDKSEGIWFKNSIGTYSHGPFLSKNPHIADFLIAQALKLDSLEPLNDDLIIRAHNSAQKLKRV